MRIIRILHEKKNLLRETEFPFTESQTKTRWRETISLSVLQRPRIFLWIFGCTIISDHQKPLKLTIKEIFFSFLRLSFLIFIFSIKLHSDFLDVHYKLIFGFWEWHENLLQESFDSCKRTVSSNLWRTKIQLHEPSLCFFVIIVIVVSVKANFKCQLSTSASRI